MPVFDVVTAAAGDLGRAGPSTAANRPEPLIVLDVMRPDMDVLRMSIRLAAGGRDPDFPCSFLTARERPMEDKVPRPLKNPHGGMTM